MFSQNIKIIQLFRTMIVPRTIKSKFFYSLFEYIPEESSPDSFPDETKATDSLLGC